MTPMNCRSKQSVPSQGPQPWCVQHSLAIHLLHKSLLAVPKIWQASHQLVQMAWSWAAVSSASVTGLRWAVMQPPRWLKISILGHCPCPCKDLLLHCSTCWATIDDFVTSGDLRRQVLFHDWFFRCSNIRMHLAFIQLNCIISPCHAPDFRGTCRWSSSALGWRALKGP